MKSDKNVNITKNFFSKRSTRNIVGSLVTLSLLVALFNSASFPVVVQQIKKIQRMILDGVVFSKDPDIVYHREEILSDYQDRVGEDFTIPAGLRDRVGFWFDIYTRYDSNRKVVHHTLYPWVVFKVVDITSIINSDTPKARWMRNVKADEFVTDEVQNIREALKELARGAELDEEDEYQVLAAKALEVLPGSLRNKAKEALKNVRVQTGQKNFFAEGIEVSPIYLSGMEEIFRNHKLPVELTRIPFVESSFNRHAVSKVGASGIWQFMDYTGKSFMTVNEHIDERNSPFKATNAAARLLKENHMILRRSWPLAVTAWNHGPSGIRRAMKAAESEDLSEIINSYQSRTFDFASSNFYCEFLAALYAEKYHEQIFKDLEYEKTLDLHTVKLARSISAKELLRRSGLAKEDFVMYNPDLKKALERNASIPSGFTLMVDTPARLVLKSLLTKDTRPDDTKVSQSEVSYNGDDVSRN
ncbi:lytic transglycosylase domain-containing protein [Bdellovibrio bacteriovorus]|uniref:lytic transglycosylase domain-containing protein n=1 Tax=Bdellovibrio TaxID=958 RepID=UPI0035A8DA78